MDDRTLIGQQLGNYRVLRQLGEGSFARVYLGHHLHLETQAAIKVVVTPFSEDALEQFRREARTIARLSHPHIVRVLEFGVEGQTPYLVMEYAPKGTVRQRYPPGTPLPLETITRYVTQVASALQYAHDRQMIHRDLKPENLLLLPDDEVLLSDFGVAVEALRTQEQITGTFAGTAAYEAPEQLQGKPVPASDQYALAVIVYEWLCGERPFHGSALEIASQKVLAQPPPLRERVVDLSPLVEQVVMMALAKAPNERFGRVDAFARAFEQAVQLGDTWRDAPTVVSLPSRAGDQPAPSAPSPTAGRGALASAALPPGEGNTRVRG